VRFCFLIHLAPNRQVFSRSFFYRALHFIFPLSPFFSHQISQAQRSKTQSPGARTLRRGLPRIFSPPNTEVSIAPLLSIVVLLDALFL